MDETDRIWNRPIEPGSAPPFTGDIALEAALEFHSSAMNGGVLDAVERRIPESLAAAQSAFSWLGLESIAQIIADVRAEIAAGTLDENQADQLEISADERYGAAIPSDVALEAAFKKREREDPDAFSTLDRGHPLNEDSQLREYRTGNLKFDW